MGLDFTTIKDQPGAAIYFIHDGSEQGKLRFEGLMSRVASRTKKQMILMSEDDENGSAITKFYQLRGIGGFVLIVRDDDQLHRSWNGRDRLDPSEIAYAADRAG